MPSIKKLQSDQASLKTIGDFFSAYQKLTIYQMQKNRDLTIKSRDFFEGLLETFIDLKQDFKRLIKKKDTDIISFSTLTKNGKTVSVFLSFETKFSTETNRRSLEFLKSNIEGKKTDLVIVGKTAKKLLNEFFPETQSFTYFDFKEENLSLKDNLPLIQHLLEYEQVDIYNPFYISLMKQEPQKATISGDIPLENKKDQQLQEKKHFLFEPEKKKLLHFFEIQILSSLLQHKIKESHLANLGSRIATLQNTQDNLELEMSKIKKLQLKTLKYKANKKQRNRLSTMVFWTN